MPQKRVPPVRVGVVGLGRFGRLHALTLARLAEAELVALVARRQDSLDALAPELPGVPGWTSLRQALAESTAEAWVVACTTAAHVPVARALPVQLLSSSETAWFSGDSDRIGFERCHRIGDPRRAWPDRERRTDRTRALASLRACLSTRRGLSDAESRVDFVQAAARE